MRRSGGIVGGASLAPSDYCDGEKRSYPDEDARQEQQSDIVRTMTLKTPQIVIH